MSRVLTLFTSTLSTVVKHRYVPDQIRDTIEKLIQSIGLVSLVFSVSLNRNIRDLLATFDPRTTSEDAYDSELTGQKLLRPLSADKNGVPYNKFFGTGRTPSHKRNITDKDIIESIFLKRIAPTKTQHKAGGEVNVLFGWFANYFVHMFLRTSPEDPTRQVIGYLSSTTIYGNSDQETGDLRTGQDGKVHLEDAFAPTLDYLDRMNGRTSPAGRKNVFQALHNTHIGLPVVHTLFLREHNRVCDVLRAAYPHYSDDDLFQVAQNATLNTLFNIVRTEYVSSLTGSRGLTTAASMGPNVLTRRLQQVLARKESAISAEYLLVYAFHGAVDEKISIRGNSHEIVTAKWFRNALGAVDATFTTRAECFEEMMVYGCTTAIKGGLNVVHGTPRFLYRAEESLMLMQRKNGVVSYNEARRQLGLQPYKDLGALVKGTALEVSEMDRLFGSVENVDFYTGITIDNTKVIAPGALCDVVVIIIASLAFGVLPLVHGALQPLLPPCLQTEVAACRRNGFLSTLLKHHVPAMSNAPTDWRFGVSSVLGN
jgi:hypothetical protein